MKIEISGTPEEITALVLGIQERFVHEYGQGVCCEGTTSEN